MAGIVVIGLCVCAPNGLSSNLQLVSSLDGSVGASSSANGISCLPVTSPNGRYICFASSANNLLPAGGSLFNSRFLNVFVRDRTNGTTILASVNPMGLPGAGNSVPAGVSSNGQYVLFESAADDLVAGDTNATGDVFVRDTVNNTTTLVSVSTSGMSGNGVSRDAVMTPDGRYVAFVSEAKNLVPNDTNGIADIFVRDVLSGTTTLVSAGAFSSAAPLTANGSDSPVITPDGRFVAFYSAATNLVPNATQAGEVYVRDLQSGTTFWASTNARSLYGATAGTSNIVSCNLALSDDGQFVAFEACPTNVNDFAGKGMVFRYNLQTSATDVIYTNANAPFTLSFENVRNIAMSADGGVVAYIANDAGNTGNTSINVWSAASGTNATASIDQATGLPVASACGGPVLDATGRYVAFISSGTNLTSDPLVAGTHLYVRDMQAGSTTLVDMDTNGVGAGIDPRFSGSYALSGDGQVVAFDSTAGNLVPGDRNAEVDVFARDLSGGATSLVSTRHSASPSLAVNGAVELSWGCMSTNGRYVVFTSEADNLTANDTNVYRDVFVRDLSVGTNILVSVATNGFSWLSNSTEPSISADGRYVAFSSDVSRLAGGDGNKLRDVFVRDLQTGTTLLVSSNVTSSVNVSGNGDSFSPIVSSGGRYILYHSKAGNLYNPGGSAGPENLFLRDMQLATNFPLTFAVAGNAVQSATMTPDGRYVAYMGYVSGSSMGLYVWDSVAANRIYTNPPGTLGPPGTQGNVSISPDGRWLAIGITTGLLAIDIVAQTNCVVATGASDIWGSLQFSTDDRFLLFVAKTNLTVGDTNGAADVYLHDFLAGTNILISRSFNSAKAGNGISDLATMSGDGRFIAYRSSASNIVPNDTNGCRDIFLYDRINGATTLVSVDAAGTSTANNLSLQPFLSGDGSRLVFESYATDLSASGYNESSAIFALNLSSSVIADADGDGMDNAWETNYFGTLARDGTGDFDGDGSSDLFEFLTGTDPTDASSVFKAQISGSVAAGQQPTINWPLAPGKSYRVQFKNNMSDPNWTDVTGTMTLVGSQGRIADLAPSTGQRFYRIVLEP